jgi:uncharacterized RDD family membrane protein YckC
LTPVDSYSMAAVPDEFVSGVGQRFGGALIDWMVIWFLINFPLSPLVVGLGIGVQSGDSDAVNSLAQHLLMSAGVLYLIVAHGSWGQTLGKRTVGIRVVRADNLAAIGYRQATLRYLFPLLMVVSGEMLVAQLPADGRVSAGEGILSLLYISIFGCYFVADVVVFLASRHLRALHDFIGGTVVIRSKPNPQPTLAMPMVSPGGDSPTAS